MKLDVIDKKLINLLQKNNRLTHKQLSSQLHLSTTAIYERIKKLERNEVIDRYVAIINKEKIEKNFMVLCAVKLVQHSKDFLTKFEREASKLEELTECFHVTGDYDYLLKIHVKDMKAYREFMVTKLTLLPHIGSTRSNFVISEIKNETAIEL